MTSLHAPHQPSKTRLIVSALIRYNKSQYTKSQYTKSQYTKFRYNKFRYKTIPPNIKPKKATSKPLTARHDTSAKVSITPQATQHPNQILTTLIVILLGALSTSVIHAEDSATPITPDTPDIASTATSSTDGVKIGNAEKWGESHADLVRQGAYIARAADCMGCHQEDYTGGVLIATPMGDTYATNITPSLQYGIGNYTEQDLKRALTQGKAPSHLLYPAMPYPAYSGMSDEDIHALFTYLQSVPAVDTAPDYQTDMRFPFNIRPLLLGWNTLNLPQWQPRPGLDDSERRGEYLVNNLAHCGTCHTPRNATMGFDSSKYLAGAMVGKWLAPNITPDLTSGIGSWSKQSIITYLREGAIPNKAQASGPMREVVTHSTSHLSNEDLNAIASYLKAIPAIKTQNTILPVNTKAITDKYTDSITFDLIEQKNHIAQAKVQASSESQALYLSKCASCHGVNGYGQPDAGYPSIVGVASLRRDDAASVIHVIAEGISEVPNTYPKMPSFKDELSAEQIANITNYVRINFGGLSFSEVTARDVTAHLNSSEQMPFLIKHAKLLTILAMMAGLIILYWAFKPLFKWYAHQRRQANKDLS